MADGGMAGWSSLPSDLVNRVAGRFLGTNDLDHYMDFRAVCHNWRSCTGDPRASPEEPRFRPRRWVMLDELKSSGDGEFGYSRLFVNGAGGHDDGTRLFVNGAGGHDDGTRLFVNTATGRFLRKALPVLHSCYCLVTTTSGGFVVLADRNSPHAARILNPFTGSVTRFRAPVPRENHLTAAVVGSGSGSANDDPFTLVTACFESHRVYWAGPESEAFLFVTSDNRCTTGLLPYLAGHYAGSKSKHGSAAATDAGDETASKMVDPVWSSAELEHRIGAAADSAGGELELLVVTLEKSSHCVQVDKKRSAAAEESLEEVASIGNHALFFGDRCLIVDADKLPSVDANCVYYQLNGPYDFLRYGIFTTSTPGKQRGSLILSAPMP